MKMHIHSPTGWQKRRSAFNHDWLKNQYLPALSKWINLLDFHVEDEFFEQSFINSVLPQWEKHREFVLAIVADFEHEMSPQTLFTSPPLYRCDIQTKQWLGELVDLLWRTRYPVEKCIASTRECIEAVEVVYVCLVNELQKCVVEELSLETLQPFRSKFVEFRKCCASLARAIEEFPNELKVV